MKKFNRKVVGKLSQVDFEALVESSLVVVQLVSEENERNSCSTSPIKFSNIVALGDFGNNGLSSSSNLNELKSFLTDADDFVFGYFSYDLRTKFENLPSENEDIIGFENFHFFVPDYILERTDGEWLVYSKGDSLPDIRSNKKAELSSLDSSSIIEKSMYVHQVENLKQHIQFGDIYEVNYCVQHRFSNAIVQPYSVFQNLLESSPAPFTCYVRHNNRHLMCSSPERFIQKVGRTIISQPIKGTNRRVNDNKRQKESLRNDQKELSENIMITDLVRNDLSKAAKKGTVKVEELCGVYEFQHVNQMISTVSAELREDVHPLDAILNAFPMGSMTGAPKIRAMELIDQFEDFSRGLYSGAVGYFTPELDFDFNVVIRSILYNSEKQVVTFPTGSAITINSNPEKEYEECLLKAEAMRNVLLSND